MRSFKLSAVLALAALGLGGFVRPPAVHAEDTATPAPPPVVGEDAELYSCKHHTGMVSVTFKPDTELKDLLTWVMGFTCKTFLFDPRIVSTSKKFTIIAPEKMSAAEGYRVFLASLAAIGLTVVTKDNALKIVESHTVKSESVPLYKHPTFDDTDEVVRYVYRPQYAAADTMRTAFSAIKSDAGDITPVGAMMIITDYSGHVRDMMSLAKLVDVPTGSDAIYTIAVNHADATKLADKLEQILGVGKAALTTGAPGVPRAGETAPAMVGMVSVTAAVPSKILVDERTNTLIVASSDAAYQRVKALVERLDIALDIEGGQSIHVFPLQSAIAEEVALTLNQAIGQQPATTAGSGSGAGARGGAGAGGAGVANASLVSGTPSGGAGADGLGATLEGKVRIIADKPSNKLIVISSGRDYIAMKDVIREIDTPRKQVYIEALIMEVNVDNELDLGTTSHGAVPTPGGNALVIGGVQSASFSSLNPSSAAGTAGLIAGVLGSALANSTSFLGQSIPSFGVLFNAMGSNSNTNILATPSVIALDNDEAKFKVGINIPYNRGTITTSTGVSTQNIDRQDLTLELDIKPHISDNGTVLLEVKHDSKDLGQIMAAGPSWTTRSFETKTLVRDQQTVVLGGLMQEHDTLITTKVPILGDIPLLGYLFKYSKTEKTKMNLLILLTPYIIKDQRDLEKLRARKTREHDEFVRAYHALDHAPFDARIDYTKKRGLLEEINQTELTIDEDVRVRGTRPTRPGMETGMVRPVASSPDQPDN